jgi:hypothetical protein
VERQVFEDGIIVIAASYEGGKMMEVEYLTVSDPSALLTGDNVSVFILDDETYAPCCEALKAKP